MMVLSRIKAGYVCLLVALLPIPFVSSYTLPDGFIAEFVSNLPAITGCWADNPRQSGKQMLLLASKTGEVSVLENPDESDEYQVVLDLPDDEICMNGERGLQSVIVHPNFSQNMYVYMFYAKFRDGCLEGIDLGPWNIVARFKMDPSTLQINFDTKEEIWRGAPTSKAMHNGGAMLFGNDGKLYVTTGDGGNMANSQPLNNVHGSVIRLNDDGTVPEDNPYTVQNGFDAYRCADTGGKVPNSTDSDGTTNGAICSEVFSHGLRNPFRLAMNPFVTDKVMFSISDVGGSFWEELNHGGSDFAMSNYGYPMREGVCESGSDVHCAPPDSTLNLLEPYHWYAHRSIKDGGCVAGASYVPSDIWPSKYQFLFIDFIFFEIYNLIEDPSVECRECSPPTSGYRNESFYVVTQSDTEENSNDGRMTDAFFGPFNNTQALYVISRGGDQAVVRIRYTDITNNGPPVPIIAVAERNFIVGEIVVFDGTQSSDPDGDQLTFVWDFGDNSTGVGVSPNHTYVDSGEYTVTLFVTDTAGQKQEITKLVTVGKPPSATILSPLEGEEFYVGEIFQLRGEAYDHLGVRLDDTQLYWEVRKHHADHFHPFLEPTNGNNLTLFPAPEPEDFFASTNTYLRIILTAIDNNGLTTEVNRIVQPSKVLVGIESDPEGLVIMVDSYSVNTSNEIVSWKEHSLNVVAENQPPYVFKSWSDGNTEPERNVKLSQDELVIQANFCLEDFWQCDNDEECCSGMCLTSVCVVETTSEPTSVGVATMAPVAPPSAPPLAEPSPSPTTITSSTPTGEPKGDPPLVTIVSPLERQKFYEGQVFRLWGFGIDGSGKILEDAQLAWELRSVVNNKQNVTTTIMELTVGNNFDSVPCPGPDSFLTASNSYLEMVLYATGENGMVTEVTRILQPDLVSVLMDSSPKGLSIQVDNLGVRTKQQIMSWKYHDLNLFVDDQASYRFVSWEDGSTDRNRTLKLSQYSNNVTANFCGEQDAICSLDSDCCSTLICGPIGVCADQSSVSGNSAQDVQQNDSGPGTAGIILIILASLAIVGLIMIVYKGLLKQASARTTNGAAGNHDVVLSHDIEKPATTSPYVATPKAFTYGANKTDVETDGGNQPDERPLNNTCTSSSDGSGPEEHVDLDLQPSAAIGV